jgi:hypothetical protein
LQVGLYSSFGASPFEISPDLDLNSTAQRIIQLNNFTHSGAHFQPYLKIPRFLRYECKITVSNWETVGWPSKADPEQGEIMVRE